MNATGLPARRLGRPRKFDRLAIKRFLRCVGRGMPLTLAADAAGVSFQTVSNHRARDERFAEALKRAIAKGVDSRLRVIERAMQSQDEAIRLRAACWWLERSPQTSSYFSRNRIEVTGADGAPLAGAVAVYLPAKDGANSEPRALTVEAVKELGNGN